MLYSEIMNRSIRALLFDFDGVILDTETPEVEVWKRIYAEHGLEFPLERLFPTIGHMDYPTFDPAKTLHQWTHDSLDQQELWARHRRQSDALIAQEPVGRGFLDVLAEARRLDLRVAVASSSSNTWVQPHLARLGLSGQLDHVVTSDYVGPGRVKPHPDIYLKALELLGIDAKEALAFEDSPPGVAAATTAGIFTVAIPNPITAMLDLSKADLVIPFLSAIPLEELLQRAVQ